MNIKNHSPTLGVEPLSGIKRAYQVFDAAGKRRLSGVRATELAEAAQQVEEHWPCRLKANHLPYAHVDVEEDGTLSPYRPGQNKDI